MKSLEKNQPDPYYADLAIRERCIKMVCDQSMFELKADAINVAESYFQYIKTGSTSFEPEELRG